jgi:chromate reductase
MQILAVSGSLQTASSNTRFLREAQVGAPPGIEVTIFGDVDAVPPFNPDLDVDPAPVAVADLRARIAAADAVLIASPEYAHGMPGALKNALDWIVGSGELYGKPVVIVCVSPRSDGGANVREDLARTLGAQGSDVVASMTVEVVRSRSEDDNGRRVADAVASIFELLADRVDS